VTSSAVAATSAISWLSLDFASAKGRIRISYLQMVRIATTVTQGRVCCKLKAG
jgi:hypothetical protein